MSRRRASSAKAPYAWSRRRSTSTSSRRTVNRCAWSFARSRTCQTDIRGRDAAGKGGTIKAITQRVSPRVFRVVALPAPSDRQKTQMYMQRYMQHFQAAGEIVIFDRSWYNRAGVEHVMGFCTDDQHERFLEHCPAAEKYIVDAGIRLIKVWLEVG